VTVTVIAMHSSSTTQGCSVFLSCTYGHLHKTNSWANLCSDNKLYMQTLIGKLNSQHTPSQAHRNHTHIHTRVHTHIHTHTYTHSHPHPNPHPHTHTNPQTHLLH
jgi:hypothetical protein